MAGHDIDLVAFHVSRQNRFGLAGDDAVTQVLGHPLHVVWIQPQLLGDLGVG